jgi:hypothetical protein
MDRIVKRLLLRVVLLISIPVVLPADSGPSDILAERADAIVVAEVTSGKVTNNSFDFVVAVTRSVKGGFVPGESVHVVGQVGRSADRSFHGNFGLWFLKVTGDGSFQLLPVRQGGWFETSAYFPLAKTASPETRSGFLAPATAGDRVALELGAAVQSYSDGQQLFTLSLGLLEMDGTPVISSVFRALASNPDPQIRFVGLTGLWLDNGDVPALTEIANNMDLLPSLHVKTFLGRSICGARETDPAVIRLLGKLTASPTTQECAAMALMYIHTREALPFLAQLLDSDNPATRESAMRGLSRFVDNLPPAADSDPMIGKDLIPSGPARYKTPETTKYSLSKTLLVQAAFSEAAYLQFWRSWWDTTGKALVQRDR